MHCLCRWNSFCYALCLQKLHMHPVLTPFSILSTRMRLLSLFKSGSLFSVPGRLRWLLFHLFSTLNCSVFLRRLPDDVVQYNYNFSSYFIRWNFWERYWRQSDWQSNTWFLVILLTRCSIRRFSIDVKVGSSSLTKASQCGSFLQPIIRWVMNALRWYNFWRLHAQSSCGLAFSSIMTV